MKRAAAILILLAGCEPFEPVHDEPASEIRVVAVLPFADQTGGSTFDADEFANILASELARVGRVRVIRPAQIRAAGEEIATTEDAVRIGRRVRADAVFACAVTEYDPYDPPKISISAQFLRVAASPLSSRDLDRVLQSGSWRRGPLSLSDNGAAHAVVAFDGVYDSRHPETRGALRRYVQGRVETEWEVLAVQSRYLQFVSNQMISRMFAYGT